MAAHDHLVDEILLVLPGTDRNIVQRLIISVQNYLTSDAEIITTVVERIISGDTEIESKDDKGKDDDNEVNEETANLNRILEIFPDCEEKHALDCLVELMSVEKVIQSFAERAYKKKAKPSNERKEINYEDTKSTISATYRTDALDVLADDFPFISIASLKDELKKKNYHYYPTFKHLYEIIYGKTEQNELGFIFQKHTTVPDTLKARCQDAGIKVIQIRKKKCSSEDLDPMLTEEIFFKNMQTKKYQEELDETMAKGLNEKEAADQGLLIECGCCFGEYPFESFAQCTEGHLFCCDCLKRYAEQTLFGIGRTGLLCLDSSGKGCTGIFTDDQIKRSVSDQVYQKYQEKLAMDDIKAAEIPDLVSCPACDFNVVLPEEERVLVCPKCEKQTCRFCREENHIPLRCEEVEKKQDTDLRLKVEEAMTKARVRECPSCKTKFFKTEGCNKMTCACGKSMCYICRKSIQGYDHFCSLPNCTHETCGNCPITTNTVEDDIRAMKEAGIEAQQKILANTQNAEVKSIDINALLEGTAPQKRDVNAVDDILGPIGFFPERRPKKRRRVR